MENLYAVITGDVVSSTSYRPDERDEMLAALRALPCVLAPIEEVRFEMFRGDGFQIGITNAIYSARIAIAIRSYLRSHKIDSRQLDARIALGIGSVEYVSEALSTCDGSAFRNSGRLLDQMRERRLEISTPWTDVDDELTLSTAFVDDIISSWTANQSKVELEALLTQKTHAEIAQGLNISRQMVDKSLRASKENLIKEYIKRFETLIAQKNT